MGGRALKHVGVERKSAPEYFEIAKDVSKLAEAFAERKAVIPAYAEKESFGDLDILVVVKPSVANLKETLQKVFNPQDIVHNDKCWSLDYKNLQVDVITSSPELFDIALHYYSYNDLNNLVGRVAHKQGLKYGHQGLILPVKFKDTYLADEIELSTDPKAIYEFLGYDYERFQKGFNNLEEIFQYVTKSPFFNKEAFAWENQNHINRTRNRKRPTFQQFTQWLDERPELPSFQYNEDKSEYITNALKHFNCMDKYEAVMADMKKREEAKAKFGGELVTQLTGLEKKELGMFIATFKKQFSDTKAFEAWLLATPQEDINAKILEAHQPDISI